MTIAFFALYFYFGLVVAYFYDRLSEVPQIALLGIRQILGAMILVFFFLNLFVVNIQKGTVRFASREATRVKSMLIIGYQR